MNSFRPLAALVALMLLSACGSNPPTVTPPPTPPDEPEPPAPPTYYQDVAPILSEACSGCHVEGGAGPFALTTLEDVVPLAAAIAHSTHEREMPPWPPAGDSPVMHHERKLTDAQIATIKEWANAGAPAGDAANPAQLPAPVVVEIGTPEVTVDIGVDYVPDDSLHDDYRCFMVDLGMTSTRMATGYRVTPGNAKTVHHVIVTLFQGSQKAGLEAIDAEDARPGWSCFGGPVPQSSPVQPADVLGGWVPGTSAVKLTPGVGVLVETGMIAVIQMHYNLHGGTDPDRTKLEVAFATPTEAQGLQRLFTLPLAKVSLRIPADAVDHSEVLSTRVTNLTGGIFFPDGDAYVVSSLGHMHLLGTSFSMSLKDTDGNVRTLLDLPKYDFHWQGSYMLKEPIRFRGTDTVRMECVYDNSPARRAAQGFTTTSGEVTWGEGTHDEMCFAYIGVTDDLPVPP